MTGRRVRGLEIGIKRVVSDPYRMTKGEIYGLRKGRKAAAMNAYFLELIETKVFQDGTVL